MPIDFHAQQNRYIYIREQIDSAWQAAIGSIVDVNGKHAVDIGCGGGIYTAALSRMGAASVTGIDFSEEMLKGAREYFQDYTNPI
jgi:2-polyprenyl-3-methyl-5-hydroxy-6-metoxy-1,4-benzoquinol methylase